MKLRKTVTAASMAALLISAGIMLPVSAANGQEVVISSPPPVANAQMVNPNTAEAAQAIQKLENVETSDAAQSMRWMGRSDQMDNNYAGKQERADELVRWMQLGHPVSQAEIDQVLKEDR